MPTAAEYKKPEAGPEQYIKRLCRCLKKVKLYIQCYGIITNVNVWLQEA